MLPCGVVACERMHHQTCCYQSLLAQATTRMGRLVRVVPLLLWAPGVEPLFAGIKKLSVVPQKSPSDLLPLKASRRRTPQVVSAAAALLPLLPTGVSAIR